MGGDFRFGNIAGLATRSPRSGPTPDQPGSRAAHPAQAPPSPEQRVPHPLESAARCGLEDGRPSCARPHSFERKSMDNEMKTMLPDVQSSHDGRNIPINRVGVRGVKTPLVVAGRDGEQHTVAELAMTVALPADQKGTHMSRFIAMLEEHGEPFSAETMRHLMLDMLDRLNAVDGTIEVRFPYFIRKTAPVSKLQSTMNYEAAWIADATNGVVTVRQIMVTPVTSLCPCSKEISRYGAHNQRSHVTTSLLLGAPMTLEEQAAIAEEAGSCQLWARLKRADEKYVTEYAYDHPKFVEDLVRDMAKALDDDERVQAYRVEAENFESIHNHSAYAWIEHDKRG